MVVSPIEHDSYSTLSIETNHQIVSAFLLGPFEVSMMSVIEKKKKIAKILYIGVGNDIVVSLVIVLGYAIGLAC
ncbi:hypothetical protein FNV43_RR19585 [Rhamnella rubrinervis]|uniref:Uncharacterized protein n=1 Tax=Rhamnella rubrinervis TaxID=2594499 RepID=A0A8K0DSY2_9ROSA|nr:hypothetical protein FNV43_RR19585 [Rhamnella rubrinervis]